MSIILFHFSGTGNTLWLSRLTARLLESGGESVRLVPISSTTKETLNNAGLESAELIGIATPIYGADFPPLVTRVLGDIQSGLNSRKDAFVISTFGHVNGMGYFAAQKRLTGFRIRQYINVRMPDNTSARQAKMIHEKPELVEKVKLDARRTMGRAVKSILDRKKWIMGIAPYLIPGILIRRLLSGPIRDFHLQLHVDGEKCTRCNLCAENCPAQAITFDGNKASFSSGCTACMHCINYCPRRAISRSGVNPDSVGKYPYRFPAD